MRTARPSARSPAFRRKCTIENRLKAGLPASVETSLSPELLNGCHSSAERAAFRRACEIAPKKILRKWKIVENYHFRPEKDRSRQRNGPFPRTPKSPDTIFILTKFFSQPYYKGRDRFRSHFTHHPWEPNMTTATAPPPQSESDVLQEYADNRGVALRVDREKGIIPGVKLLGTVSRKGRVYPKEVMAKALPLYEGMRVNVDHVDPGQRRSLRDRIGLVKNVTLKEDGLYGDFHFNPKHALAEQIAWDAENAPQNLGFSPRHPRRPAATAAADRRRVDRQGAQRGPGGQPGHDDGPFRDDD